MTEEIKGPRYIAQVERSVKGVLTYKVRAETESMRQSMDELHEMVREMETVYPAPLAEGGK
ncbi:hypothetical protein LCGC14_0369740 [marine sediment metagenome]|uniref:Uncharacterized protein n=1 Tax=marine sediment metagenome TaxID=412755 RepID=A0A0F9T5G3_9ZZZZ